MEMRIDIKGLPGAIRMIKRVSKASKKLGEEYTRESSKNMKRYAKANLKATGHTYTGRTLASMRRVTNPTKAEVFFDTPETAQVALFLEKGVKEHVVGVHSTSLSSGMTVGDWFMFQGGFPYGGTATVGIKPTYFWSRAVRKTGRDAKRLVKKYERRLKG